jgi:hypothetical protein
MVSQALTTDSFPAAWFPAAVAFLRISLAVAFSHRNLRPIRIFQPEPKLQALFFEVVTG